MPASPEPRDDDLADELRQVQRGLDRRVRRALPLMVLMLLAVFAFVITLSVTGPSPRLAQLQKEPVLVAPIPAVELGRQTRQSQYGIDNASAYVLVAYQVDVTPEGALAAWRAAYGQRYGLHDAHNASTLTTLTGSTLQVNVRVAASDRVEGTGSAGTFGAPAPGSTVVTVEVSGNS
ncbi:hypothetical protein [Cellulomonas sp. 73-145]|uniref:hypothetical protein n=1 Tax=Cellulomonas sp. 73-145 TaxID=1895739 RepID=UPI0025BF782A|nr:hypothetical protein [Cellulomonas sp. 73-145]